MTNFIRPSGRKFNQLREIILESGPIIHAEGSCLVKFGNTHVICSATVENSIPKFLKGQNQGWVTAEYSMLPRATHQRTKREATQGKLTGRTQEIQRLIGRSLRSIINLKLLGERQITIDCDVINADGGTRTAAITGAYVALHLAIRSLINKNLLKTNPLITQVAAISCGIYNDEIILDLDYNEDSSAKVDANFIINAQGNIIEIQATAEKESFSKEQLNIMLELAIPATMQLFTEQNQLLLKQNKL